MNLVILEHDKMETEFELEHLRRVFPQANIIEIVNVGDFLLALKDLPKEETVIVMNNFLPLMAVREDYDEWRQKLDSAFPEVTLDWNHQQAGLRIVKYMREHGIAIPVVIHTHSSEQFIDPYLLEDPRVRYCMKDIKFSTLTHCIRELMSV